METMIVTGGAGHESGRTSLSTLAFGKRGIRASGGRTSRDRGLTALGFALVQPAPTPDPTLDVTHARLR